MDEYTEFLQKYFPYSNLSDSNKRDLYNLVCENNIMSEACFNCMDTDKGNLHTDKMMYYLRYKDGVNKLLIYIPLNDEIGIYACMRYAIEQFLKFIYSIYLTTTTEHINRTSYRHIKEEIKLMTNMPDDVKRKVKGLYTYYAKYSNNIHDKRVEYEHELTFLSDLLKEENKFGDSVSDLRNIIYCGYDILVSIFDISYEQLNLSSRMQLAKIKPSKRQKKILSLLNYES